MESNTALELAVDAAAFIDSQRRGPFWARSTDADAAIDHTLYAGTAGIILFLLELADAAGEDAYRDRAVIAGRELATVISAKTWGSGAFATGWPGWMFVFDELHRRTDDLEFADARRRCADRLLAQSVPLGAGIGWIEPMPFSDITGCTGDREIYDLSVGAGGAALALLTVSGSTGDALLQEAAVNVGRRLVEVGEPTPDGRRFGLMSDMPFPFTAPNFAHGGAGVGYLFARLYEATSDVTFLDAAVDAARYVASRACSTGSGSLVCHTEEQPPAFYLGQCHGPAGTGRLFSLLHRLTGDDSYAEMVAALFRGVEDLGAPEVRSWGWWDNHSRCCGDAGLGDAALLLSHGTNAKPGLVDRLDALAHRCASVIEERSSVGPFGRSWTQAEHRTRPRFVQAQTGYMQGAAGIGSFLVHLATAAHATPVRIALPDDLV